MSVSAAFYISVDGGANQSGGVEVTSGQSVQFIPVSVVGWLRARYEIYDYPEGWPTPAGWTLDGATGTIYVDDVSALGPTAIVMPDNGEYWGKWMPRLLVNEQLDTDTEELDGLLDDANAICLLSPSGLRDSGAREGQHFTTATTRVKNWLRDYQRNLRALESMIGGSGSITDETIRWAPTASPNGEAASTQVAPDTTDATPLNALVIEVADETTVGIQGTIIGRGEEGSNFEIDVRGTWERTGGTLTELRNLTPFNAFAGNPGTWAAELDVVADEPTFVLTGEAGVRVGWSIMATAQVRALEATPAPSGPAEWDGETPLVDWDPTNATHSDDGGTERVDTLPNAPAIGVARTATGTTTTRPVFIASDAAFNNEPTIHFVSGNTPHLDFGDLGITTDGPVTMYFVASSNGDSDREVINFSAGEANITTDGTGGITAWADTNASPVLTTGAKAINAPFIVALSLDAGTQRVFFSSATESDSDVSDGAIFSAGGMLGNHASFTNDAFCLNGKFARGLIFPTAHDATKRAAVLAALGSLYGVTIV